MQNNVKLNLQHLYYEIITIYQHLINNVYKPYFCSLLTTYSCTYNLVMANRARLQLSK